MIKNKQPNLIAFVKTPNVGFINKDTINTGIREGGANSVLVNFQSLLSSILPLAPPVIFHKIYTK